MGLLPQGGMAFTYPGAQTYCSNLAGATGYTGWRPGSLAEHQATYADHSASCIGNPLLYTDWTGTTCVSRHQNYAYAFGWPTGQRSGGLTQDKYGTYSWADVLCIRQGP